MITNKKILYFVLIPLCIIGIVTISLFVAFSNKPLDSFALESQNSYKVGMYSNVLGKVQRTLPEVSDEGLESYPVYGTTLTLTDEEKQAILDENSYINASDTTYDSMDGDGNLYLNGESINRKLYKHSASIGMYYGDVSDSEPAVIKEISYISRPSGNLITGLYAPSGEVIKIEISEGDLSTTGGLTILIGQALSNNQANNIWLAKDFNRMPVILNKMSVNSSVSYVGSYLGGPIYVSPNVANTNFTIKISGAVEYSHFILGETTKEDFERTKNSTAPYFDLEVWDRGVRHSGPKKYAEKYNYDTLTKVGVLWDKISAVSTKVPAGSRTDKGIDFLYDPFVAAGSMVAFVGRNTVNCPAYVLEQTLDYESCINNGFWGVIHEYNHHFQRYGFNPGDEVTNNAISLVEYSLFTKISSNRTTSDQTSYGLSGWNRYTNADWVLQTTITNASTLEANYNLDGYANLLHSFGQDTFIKATQVGGGSGGVDTWFKAVSEATGYDMSYYFQTLLNATISDEVLEEYCARNNPMYVPISSIYQTGFQYGNNTIKTMQPYLIEDSINIDFSNCITLPEGFSFVINNISRPTNGSLTKTATNQYTYKLLNHSQSGEIVVNISITKDDGEFEVQDINMILEFAKDQKEDILERTIYVYESDTMYSSLSNAISNNFAGYSEIIEEDNVNPTQNSNSEIWVPNPTSNAIMQITGKIEITDTAKYRLAVRGRYQVQLYTSLDGENYSLAVDYLNATNSPYFDTTDSTKYVDLNLTSGDYVYFRAYLLVTQSNCFIGLGLGKFIGDEVSVSYLNAYRQDYIKEEFLTDYFYTKDISYSIQEDIKTSQTLISSQYSQWDETHLIDYLFDDDETNFIHSDRQDISESNPFEIVVDLNEDITANKLTIVGEPSRVYLPTKYQLYIGNSLDNMQLVIDETEASISNYCVSKVFDTCNFRYYKLIVTDTSATSQLYRYIAFRSVKFSIDLSSGKQISPDEDMFNYYGEWEQTNHLSTFGHINETTNGIIEFNFTGTQFAINSYCSMDYGQFEIYIDGQLISNPTLNSDSNSIRTIYISNTLENKSHKVQIIAKEKFNIESIIIWQ